MRPWSYTVSSQTTSPVFIPDYIISPFNIGMAVVVSGTLTYTVQHTFDDVFAPGFDPATATWIDHSTLAAQSTTKDSNYAFPVRGIRLNVTAYTNGSATINLVQAGAA
jgi:hypothetical protein